MPICAECGVPLAPDQRYCVTCGARRAPLPPAVADLISGFAAGPWLGGSGSTGDSDPFATRRERSGAGAFLASLPPRASAVAVMSMLAFGVVVGSGASSLADSSSGPLLLAVSHPKSPTPATSVAAPVDNSASSGGSSSGGGNSGPTVVTQTVAAQTVTAPGGGGGSSAPAPVHIPTTPSTTPTTPLPPVTHVFVIMLSGQGFAQLYGSQSPYPYLKGTLRPQGELLPNYYAVAPSSLANGIALMSGQGPTAQTAADCPQYQAVTPATPATGGQVTGDGCVYPTPALSIADQLTATGQTWKAYVEGMASGPAATSPSTTTSTTTTNTSSASATAPASTTTSPSTTTSGAPPDTSPTCRHPALGSPDADQAPRAGDPYVTWRNPFVYFTSIVSGTTCTTQDVDLSQLTADLKSESTTPALSYIVPTPCDNGSGQSCTPGQPADPKAAALATDAFLKQVVPAIEHSAAYKAGGLIAITSDQAPQTGPLADSSACCNNPAYPNLATTTGSSSTTSTSAAPTTTAPATSSDTTSTTATSTTSTTTTTTTTTTAGTTPTGSSTTTGPSTSAPAGNGQVTPTGGGGKVGMLLISPYVKPNSTDKLDDYNHYSLLASIESLFTLGRIGYAAAPSLPVFNSVVYNAYHPPGG
jgi:phosphatidylinositol-3-phosphatase